MQCTCWKNLGGFPPVTGDALFSSNGWSDQGSSGGQVHGAGDPGCWVYNSDGTYSEEAIALEPNLQRHNDRVARDKQGEIFDGR